MTLFIKSMKWPMALFACLQSGLAFAAPEVGFWWNANESGRGFFIEMKGDVLFMAGYFSADDGRATWAVSGGPITDVNNYTGTLEQVRNEQIAGQTVVCSLSGGTGSVGDTFVNMPISLPFDFDYRYLLFEANGTVTGQIATLSLLAFLVTETCPTPSGTVVLGSVYGIYLKLPIHGRHWHNHTEGTIPIEIVFPDISATTTWNIVAQPAP